MKYGKRPLFAKADAQTATKPSIKGPLSANSGLRPAKCSALLGAIAKFFNELPLPPTPLIVGVPA